MSARTDTTTTLYVQYEYVILINIQPIIHLETVAHDLQTRGKLHRKTTRGKTC